MTVKAQSTHSGVAEQQPHSQMQLSAQSRTPLFFAKGGLPFSMGYSQRILSPADRANDVD